MTVISACEQGKQPGKVRELLVVMQRVGLEPVMKAQEPLAELQQKGFVRSAIAYSAVSVH